VHVTHAVGGAVAVSNDDGCHSGYSSCLGLSARLPGNLLFTAHGKTSLTIQVSSLRDAPYDLSILNYSFMPNYRGRSFVWGRLDRKHSLSASSLCTKTNGLAGA